MSYTNKKGCDMPSKAMKLNPCTTAKCKRICGDITEERRLQIFNYYWSVGSLQRQKDWIAKSAIKKQVKTHTTDKGESSRRNCTYEYYINEGEGRRQVCQSSY
ncbi:hypothetical protein PYW07_009633 [Mythimna separata]|uniref:Uncharacterized protein n=1 Tax=Mythimna separata TaxID=271217 RepID=A0AAD7YBW5_MYTSE|nr:hypothetical protein PYW07_009633 [Mythimna separata]